MCEAVKLRLDCLCNAQSFAVIRKFINHWKGVSLNTDNFKFDLNSLNYRPGLPAMCEPSLPMHLARCY